MAYYRRAASGAGSEPFEVLDVELGSRFNNGMISGACRVRLHPCTSRGKCVCECHVRQMRHPFYGTAIPLTTGTNATIRIPLSALSPTPTAGEPEASDG